jgi:ABC-type bacteriocin/lantibiotic exporter with double-glycine peptidase domain
MSAFALQILVTWGTLGCPVSSDDLEYLAQRVLEHRKACGPISAYVCLRRLGHDVRLEDLLKQASLDGQGSRVAELVALLRERGVPATLVEGDRANLDTIPPYSILLIGKSHCVVFVGMEGEGRSVCYIEPSDCSLRSVPRQIMNRDWTGEAILIQSPELGWPQFLSLLGVTLTGVILLWFILRISWSVKFLRAGGTLS